MARQEVLMEPHSPGSPASPPSPGKPSSPELPEPSPETPPSDEAPEEETAVNPDDRKSSSPSSSSSSSSSRAASAGCVFHVEAAEMSTPLVVEAPDDDGDHANSGAGAERKLPDEWASWAEPSPSKTVDDGPLLSDGGTVSVAPESQTMAKPAATMEGFNPDRIPASIFQPKTSSSQQEWSIASNESLFSIHGASHSQSDDFYAPSRSHFDIFYDEAMAAGASAEPDWKLPPLAEVSEHGGVTVPGSAVSDASDGSAAAKKAAMALRRHESGSFGSSSNFSFAFPILAEPTPGKKESMGGYQQLQKEHEHSSPPTPSDRKSQFEEMTTEEERRRRNNTGWCWCRECCGCCWFPYCSCSWSTCCCCCFQRRWSCCSCFQRRSSYFSCSCSCPSLCRCSWCQ